MGPGPRGPFQRTMSMDGKPPGAAAGAGRRPMLTKQEKMMGSPDGYPENMGVCLSDPHLFALHISLTIISVPSNLAVVNHNLL